MLKKNLIEQKEIQNKINLLPKGTLKKRNFGNKTYFYLAYRENKKIINKYIGNNQKEADEIMKLVEERKNIEIQLKELKKEWATYEKVGISKHSDELKQVIDESAKGNDFNLSLRGFLDIFYSYKYNKAKMVSLIKHEPNQYECVPDYQYAICAATAHKLANDFGVKVPSWVWKNRYFLKEMYFGGVGKTRLRIYNMLYSPPEFKHRSLFVDENILTRV